MRFSPALIAVSSMLVCGSASADVVSLSAMGFVFHDPSGTTEGPTPDNGTLSPVIGIDLYAGVNFPVNGNSICKLTLVYGDTNGTEGISATLFRKKIVIGGTVDAAPEQLAKVASSGTVTGMQAKSTTSVKVRPIDEVNYFYYVKVTAQNFNTPLVGVQIDNRATCP
jgi:hypothetical protein